MPSVVQYSSVAETPFEECFHPIRPDPHPSHQSHPELEAHSAGHGEMLGVEGLLLKRAAKMMLEREEKELRMIANDGQGWRGCLKSLQGHMLGNGEILVSFPQV